MVVWSEFIIFHNHNSDSNLEWVTEDNGVDGIELAGFDESQSEDGGNINENLAIDQATFKSPPSRPPPMSRGAPELMPTEFPVDFSDYVLPIHGDINARTQLGRMRKLRKLHDWDPEYAKKFLLANRSKFL